MSENKQVLAEVVVTGYGGQQKRATLTTAISKMDNKVLEKAAVSNVGNALQGTVTGLRVISESGQPGASLTSLFVVVLLSQVVTMAPSSLWMVSSVRA